MKMAMSWWPLETAQFFIVRFSRPEILVGGSSRLKIGRGDRRDFQDANAIRPDFLLGRFHVSNTVLQRIYQAKATSFSMFSPPFASRHPSSLTSIGSGPHVTSLDTQGRV